MRGGCNGRSRADVPFPAPSLSMIVKGSHLFYVLLLNVLAVLVNTSARSTSEEGLIKLTDIRGVDRRDVYSWTISADEQERLSVLLGLDFYETGVVATLVNAPPHVCEYCGKETEFIDWVSTALTRGVHTPEFIFQSLVLGNTPKGLEHDVYCSRCGHLTRFRNNDGTEGLAPHISVAPPYDRATRTFMISKRAGIEVGRQDAEMIDDDKADLPPQERASLDSGDSQPGTADASYWHSSNWAVRREAEPASYWHSSN
ncbi:hypothetical protein C8Q80DRAFT_1204256 [Daedaleopsis nitida]|nr:hypothetical protein C8Q80DRAFT_1204256 [Daedaleopsis nitida]